MTIDNNKTSEFAVLSEEQQQELYPELFHSSLERREDIDSESIYLRDCNSIAEPLTY